METAEMTAEQVAEESAAFSAVFNPDQEPEVTPVDESLEEGQPVTIEPVIEEPKSLTVNDLKAMLDEQRDISKKAHEKLAGTVGNLQQRIEAAKVTAAGFSPKVRDRVTAEFPELAQLLFDDEPIQPATENQPVTVATSEPTEDDIAEAKELLALDHSDWQTVVLSQEYADWLTTLPRVVQSKVAKSYDPVFGSSMITKFKAIQAEKANKTADTAVVTAAAVKAKKDKLDLGLTPRGVPRTVTAGNSQDDEENAAFKAAFKPPISRR